MSIELDDEDLLDIDGSDDPTQSFSNKGILATIGKLRAPARKNRSPFARGEAAPQTREVLPTFAKAPATMLPPRLGGQVDDATMVHKPAATPRLGDREDVRETIPVPMKILSRNETPPAAAAPVPASLKSPTISPVPSIRKRNANSSYPPIAINVGSHGAHRGPAMSFISERPSRAGWITAAIIGALILIGGSIKVATPKTPAVEPPHAAAVEAPAERTEHAEATEEAKVVTFGDSQGVAIKPKADDKKPEAPKADDKKPDAKKPAAHVVTVKPFVKPGPKTADTSLAASKDKDDKIPATSHDSSSTKAEMSKAEQKKLKSIEQDLADLQLKAAAR